VVTEDGEIQQQAACDAAPGVTTNDAVGVDERDLYVRARVRLPVSGGKCDGEGAGTTVRRAGAGFVACLFHPGEQSLDGDGNGTSAFELQMFRFDGEDLVSATPTRLGDGEFTVGDDPGAQTAWGDRWVTVALLANGGDLLCTVSGESMRGGHSVRWDRSVDGFDGAPASGRAGLVTWGASASFDDFRVVSLP